jgi:hypothetical protein
MFTLRCTKTLLKRIKTPPNASPPVPNTVLGDWYANLLLTRPKQLVLCVSERTLLPILVEATDPGTLGSRLQKATVEMLRVIEVPEDRIRAEEAAMGELLVSTTASRRVLGSMNDFAHMLAYHPSGRSPAAIALELAEAPCSPIGMNSPRRATLELFTKPRLQLVK